MAKRRKFRPEFKFQIDEWLHIPKNILSSECELFQVKHHNIYSRSDIRYILRDVFGGYYEIHKDIIESSASVSFLKQETLEILYGKN